MTTKITRFLLLFLSIFVVGGGKNAVAQETSSPTFYKPGTRLTTLTQGAEIFIYNTCNVVDDNATTTEDRTGFFYDNGNSVGVTQKKPFAGSNQMYDKVGGKHIWIIASVESLSDDNGDYYKVALKNKSSNQYIAFDGAVTATDEQYLYLRRWKTGTVGNAGRDIGCESADGTTNTISTNIGDIEAVWSVRQNAASGNFWSGSQGRFATWSAAHPYALYSANDASEEYGTLAANARQAVNSALTSAQAKLTDAGYTYTEAAVNLSGKLSSNATQENDGDGLAALIDNDATTFYHSRWKDTPVNEPHYIQIDLGEGESASGFKFNYMTRANNGQHPTVIEITGSTDGTTFVPLTTLTEEMDGLPTTNGATFTSSPLFFASDYRYFRFSVTKNNTGGTFGGYPFFALAEFGFSTETVSVTNTAYTGKRAALYALAQTIATVPADINTLFIEEITPLTSALNGATEAATAQTYPFTLTTDLDNPVCYAIRFGRSGNYYLTLDPDASGKVKLENNVDYTSNIYKYWFFTEDAKNGSLLIHPFIEGDSPLGYTTVTNGPGKLTNVPPTDGFAGYHYTLVASENESYPYAFKPYGSSTYVSNFGGTDQYIGFYNQIDQGTMLAFDSIRNAPSNKLIELKEAADRTYANIHQRDVVISTELNQYTQASFDSVSALINDATTTLTSAATTAEETLTSKIEALNNAKLLLNQPATNGFYRLRCADTDTNMKYLQSTIATSNNRPNMISGDDGKGIESIFYYDEDRRLIAYSTGRYMADRSVTAIGTTGPAFTFSEANNGTLGKYNIQAGARYQYGSGDTADSGNSTNTSEGYNWWLEDVEELPVNINTAGYATLYAPVALTVPEGVTAYAATAGEDESTLNLTAIEAGSTIPANTGVILYAEETDTKNFTIATDAAETSVSSLLTGTTMTKTLASITDAGKKVYTLQPDPDTNEGVGLYRYNGENVTGFRARLERDADSSAKGFRLIFGTATGIQGTEAEPATGELRIYDLTGRRLTRPVKGLNIINGKKVLITNP